MPKKYQNYLKMKTREYKFSELYLLPDQFIFV